MKKTIKGIFLGLMALCTAFLVTACGKTRDVKTIDIFRYFEDTVNVEYAKFGENNSISATRTSMELKNQILGTDANVWRYTQIELTGQKKWICSIEVQKIEFTILSNADAVLDLKLHLTNVTNTEKYNASGDYYYFEKSTTQNLKANKNCTVSFEVNQIISDSKAPVLKLNIDDLCYRENKDLVLQIVDIKVYGEHLA